MTVFREHTTHRTIKSASGCSSIAVTSASTAWPISFSPGGQLGASIGTELLIANTGGGDAIVRFGIDNTIHVSTLGDTPGAFLISAGRAILFDENEIAATTATWLAVKAVTGGFTTLVPYRCKSEAALVFSDVYASADLINRQLPAGTGTPT